MNLADRIPADRKLDPAEALDAFLAWAADKGLQLYPHQEEAVLELAEDKHVILATPTGSGKSLVATALHFFALARRERSIYTSPIKALVSEKFFQLCDDFGPDKVGLLTGDASVNRDAPILCCTAEILANLCLQEGADADADQIVMDEFHYYADRDRGMAWQIPLLVLEHATFLLMSATLGDTTLLEQDLAKRTGRQVAVVTAVHRPVPLHYEYSEVPLHEKVASLLQEGKAPVYLVHFSQRDAAETAQSLLSVPIADKDGKRAIADALIGEKWPTPYGKDLQRMLRHGIGLHHAGLLPRYRRVVERLSQKGLLPVICGTDTLGVGINVPLRTVVLTKLCKFDGEHTRLLSVRELQQIAGRAGRKGYDTEGWVVAQAPEHVIYNRRMESKIGKDGRPKSFVKQRPPEKGFVPWNKETFDRLVGGKSEKLESVFRIDAGHLMMVLHRGRGLKPLCQLIGKSHERPYVQLQLRRDLARLFRALRAAGVVEVVRRLEARGSEARPAEGLQEDFSLHHTLSLYLVDALGRLDREYRAAEGVDLDESYALDVVTLTEAILENPTAILLHQQNKARARVIAELKADGVPFDERKELIETVTWPKPKAEWIYATFDEFAERHPWVQHEAIRPKSVVREMAELFASFDDYVKDYDLEPMEGVLLRYLTQVYKALQQNVPQDLKTDAVFEIVGYLRALLARVDSSLVQEWEALRQGGAPLHLDHIEEELPKRVDLARDRKTFLARVRAETHRLVKALADGAWEEAAASLHVAEGQEAWTPERLAEALDRFVEANGPLVFDHRTRLGESIAIRQTDRRVWSVSQTLYTAEEDSGWRLQAEVDLRGEREADGPLLWLLELGPAAGWGA